jgi:hypothetical protein
VDGGEAHDSVCEITLSIWILNFGRSRLVLFGLWYRDVSGTGTDRARLSPARTQKHQPASSKIQNPYRRGIHRLNRQFLHRPHHFKK